MVLHQKKKMECSLRVVDESLPLVEEFWVSGILFMSDGRLEREMDRWIGALSAVMRVMVPCGGKGAEPEGKAFNLLGHLCSSTHL